MIFNGSIQSIRFLIMATFVAFNFDFQYFLQLIIMPKKKFFSKITKQRKELGFFRFKDQG